MTFHHTLAIGTVAGLIGVLGSPAAITSAAPFEHVCAWAAYDAAGEGVGDNARGYHGAVYDGRYLYFAPNRNVSGYHGEVLRYDTGAFFDRTSSWAAFNPADHGVGHEPKGFRDAVFDGRYVYFVPCRHNHGYHGEVLRYDTQGAFAEVASWTSFDPGDEDVGDDPDGYIGGVFDGRYVYFAPYHNGTGQHGEVLRLDTTGDFTNTSSWTTYDAAAYGVGTKFGYAGAVFDGRYVYFVPNCTSDTTHHGEVRRYDTTGVFADSSSWAAYDAGDHGLGEDPDGYVGGVFDGRYIYFAASFNDPTRHGEMLRLDTTGDFLSLASWTVFDPGDHGVGDDPDGFGGPSFDGRYVYFAPYHNGTTYSSEVLRYDTTGDFSTTAAWDTFDPDTFGVTNGYGGYGGCIFDGRHLYFTPNNFTYGHGEFLRYTIRGCPGDFDGDADVDLDDYPSFTTCFTGPDNGPVVPGCEVGDFDNDDDMDCIDWDEFVLAWSGPDDPPEFTPCAIDVPLAAAWPHSSPKNRYISFAPNHAEEAAFRVEITDSAYFPASVGTARWVGEPGQFDIAPLVEEPVLRVWTESVVHVGDCLIVPATTYAVMASPDGVRLSDSLSVPTVAPPAPKYWADCVGSIEGETWNGPNGVVNMDDVMAAIQKFQQLAGAPPLTWVDVDPEVPNAVLNFTDIMRIVQGFKSEEYPFSAPAECP